MSTCLNHPSYPATATCVTCGNPYCGSCLVQFLGGHSCGPCRDAALAQMQGRNALIFTPARRWKGSGFGTLCQLGLFFGFLILGLIGTLMVPHSLPWLQGIVFLIFFALAIAAPVLSINRLSLWGNQRLRQDVMEKVTGLGAGEAARDGTFVGISPCETPRQYDGDTDWDVGFLLIRPGWAAYYGDRVWFCLRPDQVSSVELVPPRPQPLAENRLMVRWYDATTNASGVISFASRDVRVRSEKRAAAEALRAQLEVWAAQPVLVATGNLPLPPATLRSGPTSVLAGNEPGGWALQLGIGIPMGVLAALGAVGLKKATGTEVPMPLVIGIVIVASAGIAQGILNRRKGGNA